MRVYKWGMGFRKGNFEAVIIKLPPTNDVAGIVSRPCSIDLARCLGRTHKKVNSIHFISRDTSTILQQ